MREAVSPGRIARVVTLKLSALATLCALPLLSAAAAGQEAPATSAVEQVELTETEIIEADTDGSFDDAENSIDNVARERQRSFTVDIRTAYTGTNFEFLGDKNDVDDELRMRWRLQGVYGLTDYLRVSTRIAGLCTSTECDPNWVMEDSIPTPNGMADGDITLDEMFLHWYRLEHFDLAIGRMQTKFVARGGVYAKSLDRNDSNNTNVNWTDGLHTTYRGKRGWNSHLILQHNSPDGATNIRRGPLDFSDSSARVSYFVALENLERTPYFLQRGFDFSYLPASLKKDGGLSGAREDYYAFVARSSNRWPDRDDGPRIRLASEIGYAPSTQTSASTGIAGGGDTDGLAWNIALSLMEFVPNHSIGVNYGRVGAGWLLSPQFRQNERLTEIRYQWRRNRNLSFEVRLRQRKELEQLVLVDERREELDFFIRFTWARLAGR